MADSGPISWFNLLPTETIMQIFILASQYTDVGSLRSNSAFPSAALRVNRQWRGIALATPSIWANPVIIAHKSAGHRLKEYLQYGLPDQLTHLDVLVPALGAATHDDQLTDRLSNTIFLLRPDSRCFRSTRLVAGEGASTVSLMYIHRALGRAWGPTLERSEMAGYDMLTEAGQLVEGILPFASTFRLYSQLRFLSLEGVSPCGLEMAEENVPEYYLPHLEELHLTKVNHTALVLLSYFSMPNLYILAIDCSSRSSSESTGPVDDGGLAAYGAQYIRAQHIILYNLPSSVDIRKIISHAFRAQYLALTFDDNHDFETHLLPTLVNLPFLRLHTLSFQSRHPGLNLIRRWVESGLPRLKTIELGRLATLDADGEDLEWLRANAKLELRSADELGFSQVLARVTGQRPPTI
ncbi:hypothetical protein FRB95_006387 [Tulasnella sp. JGI-2019a]|nr:hypothetical protein FRB95_006387 [Tulasnella sp. JGI-2019a]